MRACWINAEILANPQIPGTGRTQGDMALVLAHEVGHILTDYGHPDENGGFSPLLGTDRTRRLMHSGDIFHGGRIGDVLGKEEWDAAETWLSKFVDSPVR